MNTALTRRIIEHVDIEYAVDLVQALVRTPSVVGEEGPIGRVLEARLDDLGAGKVWREEVEPGRDNVFWEIEGERTGPRLLLTGHLDTKPVCEGWERDPYGGEREDTRVFGHAIMDMKAGLVAQVTAMKALLDAGVALEGVMTFGAVADHMGAQSGAISLVNAHEYDHAILGEPTDMEVYIAHRGRYYFDISTIGLSAHTCHRDKAINAIERMLPVIEEISAIRHFPDIEPDIKDLVGEELLMAVGRIYGGLFPGGPSMIPDRCTVRVDTRPQPGVAVEEVQGLLEAAIDRAKARDPQIRTELVLADRKDAFMVARDAPIVRHASAAWEHVMGTAVPIHGGSWLADTASMGPYVDTVIFGPGGDPVYTPNESLAIEDLLRAAEINALTAARVLVPGLAADYPE